MTTIFHASTYTTSFESVLIQQLQRVFTGCSTIAIKIHFGEPGNQYAFVPQDIIPITRILQKLGIGYFFFDTSVTYFSPRNRPDTHKKVALEKGWGEIGEVRTDDDFVEFPGKYMSYQVARTLVDADGVLVVTHVKGHSCTGFGGTIKNLGMGALTAKSKKDIHMGGRPVIEGDCLLCKQCEKACPYNVITVSKKGPVIGKCHGCSACTYACPHGVLRPTVAPFDSLLADGATTAQCHFKKTFFISHVVRVADNCDCVAHPNGIIADDIGILAGEDGVALDMASRDLILSTMGEDVFLKHNKKTGLHQIEAAEMLGMGSRHYQLQRSE